MSCARAHTHVLCIKHIADVAVCKPRASGVIFFRCTLARTQRLHKHTLAATNAVCGIWVSVTHSHTQHTPTLHNLYIHMHPHVRIHIANGLIKLARLSPSSSGCLLAAGPFGIDVCARPTYAHCFAPVAQGICSVFVCVCVRSGHVTLDEVRSHSARCTTSISSSLTIATTVRHTHNTRRQRRRRSDERALNEIFKTPHSSAAAAALFQRPPHRRG